MVSKNVALADACATKLGNLVTSDDQGLIRSALETVTSIEGIDGALVIIGDSVGVKGNIPELVNVEFGEEAVTCIRFPKGENR